MPSMSYDALSASAMLDANEESFGLEHFLLITLIRQM